MEGGMNEQHVSAFLLNHPVPTWLVLIVACLIALASARPFAGSWNDGSRLATVEALVDYHTLAIDQSVFVQVPVTQGASPVYYSKDASELLGVGTLDKLYIDGHYYSDKSPVPALFLAAAYHVLQKATGLNARESPDRFCFWMNLLSSGLAYVIAVGCIHVLSGRLGLANPARICVTASFMLSTVAATYAQHVNNHILLLAVVSALLLALTYLNDQSSPAPSILLLVGLLTGLGYTIDLGLGPVLLLVTTGLVVYRVRQFKLVALFGMAALPGLILHHVVNYYVGGTIAPANSVATYFQWPGCPFNDKNMTGGWKHASIGHFLVYAGALLFGKRGFFGHNLPLFLLLPALVFLLGRRIREWPEVAYSACLCGGTWLLYAASSTNSSGACCSIRWFVPLLAPAYCVLALALREREEWLSDFLLLSGFGCLLGLLMWLEGPWMMHLIKAFWPLQGLALLSWAVLAYRRYRGRLLGLNSGFPTVGKAA
jgi:hypothetical protein